MDLEFDSLTVFYGLAAVAAILGVEAVYLLFSNTQEYRTGVNRRLELSRKEPDRERVLVKLRRERGLGAGEGGVAALAWFRRLVVQSGLRVSAPRAAAQILLVGVGLFGASAYGSGSLALAAAVAAGGMAGVPLFALVTLRKRRQAAFAAKFPDAIDIIVRSLRAGHPVPVAVSMVGRELPDPVGSEFGMAADEITYGADIETALRALQDRVGQEDLTLFVTSVAIQSTTGGNLSQILDNLSKVIRERFKMRRKIRGLSAEGRASAMILNLTPFAVFVMINLVSPSFYGDVWDYPSAPYVLGGALSWMFVGNLVMRRMVNFKI
jgi:tight adherence protein B